MGRRCGKMGVRPSKSFSCSWAFFSHLFFMKRRELLQGDQQAHPALLTGMDYLVGLSQVDDVELYKLLLEFWHALTFHLYNTEMRPGAGIAAAAAGGSGAGVPGLMLGGLAQPPPLALSGGAGTANSRPFCTLYASLLSRVRQVLIRKCARPEEVLITEDETGAIVRELVRNSDTIAMYKTCRETLIYLTHLDASDTENIMQAKLNQQCSSAEEWDRDVLNTLCWAIGSISGSMSEEAEKRFLVQVIKDLLSLVEARRMKDDKAVIAANIMCVVGQYPRFLKAHWKFLKTVVLKLIEFMHEPHPGVQDMAVDTFVKISQKCKKKFVLV